MSHNARCPLCHGPLHRPRVGRLNVSEKGARWEEGQGPVLAAGGPLSAELLQQGTPSAISGRVARPGLAAGAQNWVTAEMGSDDLLRLAGSDFVLPRKARPCPQRLPASRRSFVLSIQEAEE